MVSVDPVPVQSGQAAPPRWLSWLVWCIPATFYLAAFYLRSSPAVMTAELMRSFGLGAAQLGGLSASYYYAYVVMQIPTGVFVDSWGPRKLLTLGAFAAGLGTLLFAFTGSFGMASAARALTGAATAVAWVITLKVTTHWFPPRMFATLSGLALLAGNLGAILAQVPLRVLIDHFDWRAVLSGSALVIFVIGALAWLFVRNDPVERGYASYAPEAFLGPNQTKLTDLLRGFLRIFAYRNVWLIFLAQGGFVGAILSFTALWGPPFLKARYALSSTNAAGVCSVMSICWALASPLCGYLTDRAGKRKPIYLGGSVLAAIGWACLFYLPGLPLAGFIAIAALTSFACGAVIVGFAFSKESVPVRYLGMVSGAINIGNMIGPMLLQPAIGWVLDARWSGKTAGGLRVYDVGAFQTGFLLIIGWAIIGACLISATRETNCRQTA